MANSRPTFYVLDAYALIYRGYYAFINRPVVNSKGQNTSAILGFTNTLVDIVTNNRPDALVVAFDPPVATFRHEIFPAYKAQRPETPEDIRSAVPYIRRIIEAFGIPLIEVNGYEADDVACTLALRAAEAGYTAYMVTPDKDYAQVVAEHVKILKPKRSGNEMEVWGTAEVCAGFEIERPAQVIDILALAGDASDNIPGAPGVGDVTAKKLIKSYGSVEGLYEHLDELKGKLKENLTTFRDQVMLSKRLVTIETQVDVAFDAERFTLRKPDEKLLEPLLRELEFRTLAKRLLPSQQATTPSAAPVQGSLFDMGTTEATPVAIHHYDTFKDWNANYILVDTEDAVKELAKNLCESKMICFDTETTGIDTLQAKLVGMSLAIEPGKAWYISFPKSDSLTIQWLQYFKPLLEDERIEKIGQNLKFDIQILAKYGMAVCGLVFDTMIAHYLIDPEQKHNMSYLANAYLNYQPIEIEELIGKKGAGQRTMQQVDPALVCTYAAEDADVTLRLANTLRPLLHEKALTPLADTIEMPLVSVLAAMEQEGFNIDSTTLNNYAELLRKQIIDLEISIYSATGSQFNLASPKQLGEVLFEKLALDPKARLTKTKQYSTSEETLLALRERHPVIDMILQYRGLAKLLSTYVEALPRLVSPVTGRIHSSFNQAVAATGRLSSNNPNLQNIPIRDAEGREIRKAFIPSAADRVLLAADYSQIELRLMAHMSGDEGMIADFLSGADIHTATAAKINHIALHEVSREQRSQAKTANFGIIYGISAFGLAQRLSISRTEAKSLIDNYFATYPGVKDYMDKCVHEARRKGYVETLFGRRRMLPDINSANQTVKGFAERNAINAPIQGTAADIIKLAMIRIHHQLNSQAFVSRMILQVHDELVFDVVQRELESLKVLVKSEMENVLKLSVPLMVEMGVGHTWLEAH